MFLNWMTNYSMMYRIVLCSTALPVVATQSKPTNPQKHFAAPAITPDNPKGMKPPSPALEATACGISDLDIAQL